MCSSDLLALGVNIAWYPSFTHHVLWAALWDFMKDFQDRDVAAWDEFLAARKDRPYPRPTPRPDEEGLEKQQELEQRYFGAAVAGKYANASGPEDLI